jgi:hypothetical protein
MKFSCLPREGYSDLGKAGGGIVWDPTAGVEVSKLNPLTGLIEKVKPGAVIARFDKNGEFVTKDPAIIARLKELGYRVIKEEKAEG